MLKLPGRQGFYFPRRQRFNENLKEEVTSQRAAQIEKKIENATLTQKYLEMQ